MTKPGKRQRPDDICTGFQITLLCHTQTALDELDPERVRFAVGGALDASKLIEEEIDYTLSVVRMYVEREVTKSNKEHAVKEIKADGAIVLMSRKEERAWRKTIKSGVTK